MRKMRRNLVVVGAAMAASAAALSFGSSASADLPPAPPSSGSYVGQVAYTNAGSVMMKWTWNGKSWLGMCIAGYYNR